MPKQSARMVMVNETTYSTYTPFLPEAAAGTLEVLRGHAAARNPEPHLHPARGDRGSRSGGEDGRAEGKSGGNETIPYDQLLLALGSVSRTPPIPGLIDHAMGFKGLADAIVLRNRIVENLEEANATGYHQRREELLTFVFVGGGYAGLEALAELQDFAADGWTPIRAPACTGCAGSWSRRRRGCCRRSTRTSPTTRCASFAALASTSSWRRS